MTNLRAQPSAWIKAIAFFFLGAGAVLFAIAALQLFTSVELLDSPWIGGVACGFIGYGLHRIGMKRGASSEEAA